MIERLRRIAHLALDRSLGPRSRDRWRPVVRSSDVSVMAELLAAQVCARLVPQASWSQVARRLSGFSLPARPPRERDRICTQRATAFEIKIQTLAARSGAWRPAVQWHGLEYIKAALLTRKGVVLWMVNTDFDSSVGKWAFHEVGLQVHHLSRPEHGFSGSRFGLRFLNPIRTQVEDRWLAGRIRVEGKATGAMRNARQVLAEGGIVSIKTGDFEGTGMIEVPHEGRVLRVGAGAPGLCHLLGSALFAVTVSRISGQNFQIDVGSPIEVDRTLDRRAATVRCAQALARRIATLNQVQPGVWRGVYARMNVSAGGPESN